MTGVQTCALPIYRGIKPQEGTGAPRVPLTCHCEEQSDVAISQYPAGSWGSLRRNRSCLPEIAPQGHFLALRAQGATAPLGPPRNDKSESFTPQNAYRKSCQSAWRSASALYRGIKPQEGTGAPRVPLTCHCEERSDVAISQYPAASWESYRRKRNCLPEIATSAFGLLAMTNLRASRHRMRTAKVASLHGAH